MKPFFRSMIMAVSGALVASAVVLACGSSDNSAPTTGEGTPDGDSGGSDASSADGAGGGDSGDAGSLGPHMLVELSQPSPDLYTLEADFTSGALPCTMSVTGACGLTVCTYASPPTDGGAVSPAPQVAPNAGAITVTGMRDAGPAILSYGPLGDAGSAGYLSTNTNALFFEGGDTVTVAGAGGTDLPAFSAQSVIAPDTIVLTSPACTASTCADLDRTTDLIVTWTGGGRGQVQAFFESVVVSTAAITITAVSCNFDSAAHTGTVPSAMLMNLSKTGDPGVDVNAESFLPASEVGFTVGTTTASFTVQGQGASKVTTTVSK